MRINKDKEYFKVYLSCVIIDALLTVCAIVLISISISYMVNIEFNGGLFFMICLIAFFIGLANTLSWRSLLGYSKTPDVVFEIDGDTIVFTPDRTNKTITLKSCDIKSVEIKRPIICRSGKRIVLNTEDKAYYLEDIEDIDGSYAKLAEIFNKAE